MLMKIKFSLFHLTILVLIIILGVSCRKKENVLPDYAMYTVEISCINKNEIVNVGYAVIYSEKNNILQLQTAKHILEDKNKKYFVTFKSGISRDIDNIQIPNADADIAIIEISKNTLQKDRDYQLPNFFEKEKYKAGQNIYIWHDEYDNYPERTIDIINAQNSIISFFTLGKIAKGRSGSPVFLKDTDICMGIVSGYFTVNSAVGEKILLLSLEKEYCDNSTIQHLKNISIWGKIKKIINNILKNILSLF